jgi:hypothetical protein
MVRFASTYREIEVTSTTALAAPRNSRWHTVARVTLAGPITILLSAMTFAGMPLWLPRGEAGIDHIILPLILLPAVWAILFFHAVLDRSLARVAIVALVIGAANTAMLVSHFASPRAASISQEAKQ